MKRLQAFASLGIVAGLSGALLTAHNVVRQSQRKRLDVEGTGVQNGWGMDGTFDGSVAPPTQQHGALVTFVENLFTLGKSDDNDCTRYSPAYPGLRLRSPDIGSASAEKNSSHSLTFIGRSPDGVTFPLTGETRPWPDNSRKSEFYLRLPEVSEDCPGIDVIVRDRGKEQALWHVAHLPRLFHNNLVPLTPNPVAISGGATVEGRAFQDASLPPYREVETFASDDALAGSLYNGRKPVWVELRLCSPWEVSDTAYGGRQLNIFNVREEWDVDTAEASAGNPAYHTEEFKGRNSLEARRILAFAAPDPVAQRFVQIEGSVAGEATYSETVPLRNLALTGRNSQWRVASGAQSFHLRTANGIDLFIQSERAGERGITYGREPKGSLIFRVHVASSNVAAKESPLYKVKYPKPDIEIHSLLVGDDVLYPEITDDAGNARFVVSPEFPRQKVSASPPVDLKITLQEKVNLPSSPFRLTLPVRQGKPAVSWADDQGQSANTL